MGDVAKLLGGLPWRWLAPAGLIGALLLVLLLTRCERDAAIKDGVAAKVEAGISGASVKVLEKARVADGRAAETRSTDAALLETQAAQLKDATDALPSRPLSARQRARLECVRAQRLAREGGGDAGPACRRPG